MTATTAARILAAEQEIDISDTLPASRRPRPFPSALAPNRDARGPRLPQDTRTWPVLKDEALYGLAGDIVRMIEPQSEADPAALLVTFLLFFGNAAGHTAHALVGDACHTLNEFAVIVGKSAKARKGTSKHPIRALFKLVDDEWLSHNVKTGLSTGEGLISAVRDAGESRKKGSGDDLTEEPGDPGVADKRLMVMQEEYANVLKVMTRDTNTLSGIIRQAWDDGTLQVLTRTDPLRATDAHISILGHITIDELKRYLTETESGNGFANRYLWVCATRSKLLPEGGERVDFRNVVEPLWNALHFARTCESPLQRNDEARVMWAAIYNDLSEGKPGLFGAVTGRAEAHVLRLSAIYATLDCSPTVTTDHLLAALALWHYCEASARYIFGDKTGDPDADRIMSALRENDTLDQLDIINLFARHRSAAHIAESLTMLIDAGLVTVRKEPSANGGIGRDRTVYCAT